MPTGLDARERREWCEESQRLMRMGVLRREHQGVLLGLVRAKVRWLRAHAKVRELGEVLTDSHRGLVRNPWAVAAEKSYDQYRRALAECGATPSSASRTNAVSESMTPAGPRAPRPFGIVSGGGGRA